LAVGACGDRDEHQERAPTGAICPPDSTLTYETFGREFMATYCTRCHASSVSGAARNGAPSDHDFDTLAGIEANKEHIDEYAAAGPAHVNTTMPPTEPKPSLAEREMLGEWLACEMP
jgi:hypothetical protein